MDVLEIICTFCGELIDITPADPELQRRERELYGRMQAEGAIVLCQECVKLINPEEVDHAAN